MSVGRPRWTWRSTCSTAYWSWAGRITSALRNLGRGRGQCGRTPDPCTTLGYGRFSVPNARAGPPAGAFPPRRPNWWAGGGNDVPKLEVGRELRNGSEPQSALPPET